MNQTTAAAPLPAPLPERRPPRRSRRRPVELPEYLPARMLNEFVYCPRLFFYEWVEGVFAHSADTVEGSLRHEAMEAKTDALPSPEELGESGGRARSVELASETHKLIAKLDLVEHEDGSVRPIEYKRGSPKTGDDGPEAWPADRAQVAVQAMVLRDNGYRCDEGVLFYHGSRQRVRLQISDELVAETAAHVAAARALAERGDIPAPLVDSPKCPRCSLVGICLPDETAAAGALPHNLDAARQLWLLPDEAATAAATDFDAPDDDREVRRLVPARDDLRPLYVTGHGLTIGKSGEVLQVRSAKQLVQEVRVNEISQLNIFGNVTLTAAALQGLCWAETSALVKRSPLPLVKSDPV